MKWWILEYFLGCLVTLLLFDYGLSIKCFICNSHFRQACSDPFDNRTFKLEQCDDGVTMCRKIVQEVYFNDEWDVRYLRQCAPTGIVGNFDGRECLERSGTYRVKMSYCHCDNRNGCNHGNEITTSQLVLLLPTFGVFRSIYLIM